jgi:hypothetical protein
LEEKCRAEPIVMAHACNSVHGKLRLKDHEFKASVGCRVRIDHKTTKTKLKNNNKKIRAEGPKKTPKIKLKKPCSLAKK